MSENNFAVNSTGLRKKLEENKKEIELLKQQLSQLIQEIGPIFQRVNSQMDLSNEVVNAIVDVVGKQDVEEALERARLARQVAAEAEAARQLKVLVDHQVLVAETVVTEESTMVTSETYADGKVRREQYRMLDIPSPDLRAKFVGKQVGDEVDIRGVKVQIKEIYRYDKARAEQVLKEQQEKAAEAQEAAQAAAQVVQANTDAPAAAAPAESAPAEAQG